MAVPNNKLFKQSISEFYANKIIFITGGTGYLGKLLIEKLLRSCPDLTEIWVLIRPKWSLSVEQRLEKLQNNNIFNKVRQINPDSFLKVKPITGNITEDKLGLNLNDLELVVNSVNIVFHVSGVTNFNASLKHLIETNVNGINNAIDVVQEIKELHAFVNISSLSSVYKYGQSEEKIYQTAISAKNMMKITKILSESTLNKIAVHLKGDFINKYAFTKALGDTLIHERCQNLPVAVYRPPGVGALYKEPIPGWINQGNIANKLFTGLATGFIRVFNIDPRTPAFFIPGDHCINCLIAIGWEIAQKPEGITVYNLLDQHKIIFALIIKAFPNTKYPLEKLYQYPFVLRFITESERVHECLLFIFHTLPAILWDKIYNLFGLNYKITAYTDELNSHLRFITKMSRHLTFQMDNSEKLWETLSEDDKQVFFFDLNSINWVEYLDIMAYGIKTISLGEDIANIKRAKIRHYWLMIQYYTWICMLIFAICGTLFYILNRE